MSGDRNCESRNPWAAWISTASNPAARRPPGRPGECLDDLVDLGARQLGWRVRAGFTGGGDGGRGRPQAGRSRGRMRAPPRGRSAGMPPRPRPGWRTRGATAPRRTRRRGPPIWVLECRPCGWTNECSTMMSAVPAAARTRWYSMMAGVTSPSAVALPDHMGGIATRLRSVNPANASGENSVGISGLQEQKTEDRRQKTEDRKTLPLASRLSPLASRLSPPASRLPPLASPLTPCPYRFGYFGTGGQVNGFSLICFSSTSMALSSWASLPAEADAGSLSSRMSGSKPWFSMSHWPFSL